MPPPKYSLHFQSEIFFFFLFKRKHANSTSQQTAARSAARHRHRYWKKMAEAAGEDALAAASNDETDIAQVSNSCLIVPYDCKYYCQCNLITYYICSVLICRIVVL